MGDNIYHEHKSRKHKANNKRIIWSVTTLILVFGLLTGLFNTKIQPLEAFGGAIWFKNGPHYISKSDISTREKVLVEPQESQILDKIKAETLSCEAVDDGYCQASPGYFAYKTLVTPAVPYQPGTPDRQEVIGYCTLCRDGTFSPSCAVGRGACSWHGGVSSYNVARYKTIPGKPAVSAKDAVYSYSAASYKDSSIYIAPSKPSLLQVVDF